MEQKERTSITVKDWNLGREARKCIKGGEGQKVIRYDPTSGLYRAKEVWATFVKEVVYRRGA